MIFPFESLSAENRQAGLVAGTLIGFEVATQLRHGSSELDERRSARQLRQAREATRRRSVEDGEEDGLLAQVAREAEERRRVIVGIVQRREGLPVGVGGRRVVSDRQHVGARGRGCRQPQQQGREERSQQQRLHRTTPISICAAARVASAGGARHSSRVSTRRVRRRWMR